MESPASRWSGDAIQELLRFRLHVEANVLVRLIAGNGSNALYEIEDALRRPTLFNQHRIDDLARLGFRETAATQELGAILVGACHDPLAGGLDAIDEGCG